MECASTIAARRGTSTTPPFLPRPARDPIARDTLVPVLADHALPPIPVHLVYVGGRNLPAFLDFMQPRLSRRFADAGALARPALGQLTRKSR